MTSPHHPGAAADPDGAVRVLTPDDVGRAVRRMAHEIIERNRGLDAVVLIGLQRGGVWLAEALAAAIAAVEPGATVPVGSLDVSLHRDDIGLRPIAPAAPSQVPALDGRAVVLCDDVLFTGRTVRAALDALTHHGRPRNVQLAVLVDRGHRELPIRADYVGKNLPTRRDEVVVAAAEGVVIARPGGHPAERHAAGGGEGAA
jgi:pyrimidine operon attenuation protein/uracil phosphoribosyltransferase